MTTVPHCTAVVMLCYLLGWPVIAVGSSQTEPAAQQQIYDQRWFTMADGLPHDYVYCMLEDRRGFMWFGTRDGLARFDGRTMVTYRRKRGDTTSLPDNVITCLVEDRAGNVWVGTLMGGLARLDPRTGLVRRFPLPSERARAQGSPIRGMCLDSLGRIWVITSSASMYRLDPAQRTWKAATGISSSKLGEGSRLSLYTAANGEIWSLSHTGPVVTDPHSGVSRLVLHDGCSQLNQHGLGASFASSQFVELPNGRMLMLVGSTILCIHREERLLHPLTTFIGSTSTWSMVAHPDGYVFTGSDVGIVRTEVELDTKDVQASRSDQIVANTRVYALWVDRQRRIWAATDRGIVALNNARKTLVIRDHRPASKETYTNQECRSVLVTSDHRVLVGTASGTVHELDPGSGALNLRFSLAKLIKPGPLRELLSRQGHHLAPIVSMYERRNGDLLLGTSGIGFLVCSDRLKPRRVVISDVNGFPYRLERQSSVVGSGLYAMHEVAGQRLYVGTQHLQRLLIAEFDHQYRESQPIILKDETEGLQIVWSITEMSPTELLVGTTIGLFVVDLRTRRSSLVQGTEGMNVSCTESAGSGQWYCGTYGHGVVVYDHAASKIVVPPMGDLISADDVYSITRGSHNEVWLATNRGLICYYEQHRKVRILGRNDGIGTSLFFPRAAARTPTGLILHGTNQGLLVCDPSRSRTQNIPYPVVATNVEISAQITRSIVEHLDTLHFRETDASLRFSVIAPDFEDVERVRYRYRLVGADTSWRSSGAGQTVDISYLSAGSYTLELQASDWDGMWSRPVTQIMLEVQPPWWRHPISLGTWTALGCLVVVGSAVRQRSRGRAMAAALEDARAAERRLIASTLHDGPLQDLYGVHYVLDGGRDVGTEELAVVAQAVTRARHGIGEVCSDLRAHGAPTHLGVAVDQIVDAFAKGHLELDVRRDVAVLQRSPHTTPREREACVAILRTALLNVAEHARATAVHVRCDVILGRLILTIEDNGVGNQAQLVGREGHVRGHGLKMCRAFADSCGGTLAVEHPASGGTRLSLTTARSWRRFTTTRRHR